jgi:hypothetical protein
MRKYSLLLAMLLTIALALPAAVQAQVVGRVTQVEGHVDLMKGGKLPATPAKVDDSVQTGDVVRTKSLSRAQLTFMDNTVITIAPGSRLAIEEYLFEPAKGMRNAVLQLFQGLAHVVVTKLFQVEQPDFIIKTHTAVLGVRGTELGVRLAPNASTILNFKGITRVANIFPEVGDLRFKRAQKVAFSFPPVYVECHDMQGTTVFAGLPPTQVFKVTLDDQKVFMGQMATGLMSRKGGRDAGTGMATQMASGAGVSGTAGTSGSGASAAGDSGTAGAVPSPPPTPTPTQPTIQQPSASTGQTSTSSSTGTTDSTGGGGVDTTSFAALASDTPLLSDTGTGTATTTAFNTVVNSITGTGGGVIQNQVIIIPPTDTGGTTVTTTPPPPVVPPVEPPPPPQTSVTYTFVSVSYSQWLTTFADPTGKTQTTTLTGWSQRSGLPTSTYPTYYTWTGTGTRTVEQGTLYPTSGSSTGTGYSVLSGTVTGLQGGTLTGTATSTGYNSWGSVSNYTGTVTIEPSGQSTFQYGGTLTDFRRLATATGTNISVPGTYFTQTLDGGSTDTSSAPYNTQTSTSTWAGGSRIGVLPGYYSATLTGTSTSQWTYSYLAQSYSDFTSTLAGVVSPGSGGSYTGAATIFPNNPDTPFRSGLTHPPSPYLFPRSDSLNTPIVSSITIQPDGSATGTAYDNWYNDGRFESAIYNLNQTPVSSPVTGPAPADYNFSQTFNGMMHVNTGDAGTLFANAQGWGQRTGVYPGYFSAWTGGNQNQSGAWTLSSGSFPTYLGQSNFGSPILPAVTTLGGSVPGVLGMGGTVSGVLGKSLNGTMYFYGSLLGGTSFSYSGPVRIDNDGFLNFNYTGNWLSTSGSGSASGTLNQVPGYYFTQSSSGTYNLTSSNGTNGTLSVSGSSGSRTGVYPGGLGSFSATYDLWSPTGALPASSSGPTTLSAEGVVSTSELGATFGNATYTVGSPFNYSTLGFIGITPNSGSYFNTGGIFVTPTIQVNSAVITTPSILYAFTQSYYGFRLGTSSSPFSLASIEGYAWGQRLGEAAGGAVALPASYSPNGGYFVAQNMGTAAAAPGVLTPNWLSVTGTMSGRVSGAIGSTLTGSMNFTGTSSLGTTYSYQGSVSLAPDGTLIYMYNGTAQTAGSPTPNITQAGVIQQVPGTYFTESGSGTVQTATSSLSTGPSGPTVSTATVKDASPFTGTRILGGTPTPTTSSLAGMMTSTTTPYTGGGTGSGSVSVQGVVAGSSWENRFGVATASYGGVNINGAVTLDPTGKLTGQFVDQIPNGTSSPDKVVINAVSVPTTSGQTTSSFVQTLSGGFTSTANGSGTQATTTAALAGTSAGTLSGPVNGSYLATNTAGVNGTLGTNAGNLTAYVVGVVGGPASGVQTGVGSTQVIRTITSGDGAGGFRLPRFEGTTVLTPAAGSAPPTLTTNLNGVLNVAPNGALVQTTGAVATTPKP